MRALQNSFAPKRLPRPCFLLIALAISCGGFAQEPGLLGITYSDIADPEVERLQLDSAVGAIVHLVLPSLQNDVQVDDIIVAADGKPILDSFDLSQITKDLESGQTITVELLRHGERRTTEFTASLSQEDFNTQMRKLAKEGELHAQVFFQENYLLFNQVEPGPPSDDSDSLINYLESLSNSSEPSALFAVGSSHEWGLGTAIDKKEAARWFRRAARLGYPGAMYKVAWGYHDRESPIYQQVYSWASKAADRNNVDAITCLGWCREYGLGVQRDYEKSLEHYLTAARRGYSLAQFNAGQMFRTGVAGEQNLPEALSWFEKAAAGGYADAAFQVGYAYEWAAGTEADFDRAKQMYELAIERGSIAGEWGLGTMELYGHGTAVDYSAAIKRFQVAADAGYSDAYNSLAYMLDNGLGFPRNGTIATILYLKAEKLGNTAATEQLRMRFARTAPPVTPTP
ncbi:MAG TPA: hypothetical protein DDW52_06555 [Planctomycetaceae bacterium]|nr:hypothetical protein [Planctomycetaceae bacterium]